MCFLDAVTRQSLGLRYEWGLGLLFSLEEEVVVYDAGGSCGLVGVELPAFFLVVLDYLAYSSVVVDLDAFPLFQLWFSPAVKLDMPVLSSWFCLCAIFLCIRRHT